MTEITKEWCINMANAEKAAGDPEVGAGFELMHKVMKLFSVCVPCDEQKPYDGDRAWGDFDKCQRCGETMDVWTESGVRNQLMRQPRRTPR